MFRRRSKGSNVATGAPEFKYVSAIGKGEISLDMGKGKKKPDPFGGIVGDDAATEDTASEDDRLIRAAVSALGKAIPEQHPDTNKFAGQVVENKDERSRSVRFTADTKPAAPLVKPMRSRSLMGGTLVTPTKPIGPTVNPLLQRKNGETKASAEPKLSNKVGKANLARDIPIFIAIMAALLGVALLNNDVGSTKGKPSIKGQMKQAKVALEKAYERQKLAKEAKRQVDCNLFLADSSIPGAGHGLFIGTSYQTGDQVVPVMGDGEAQDHLLMLVKHHPLVTNIDGKGRALVDLLPGDELFVAVEKHPTTTNSASVYWQQHVSIPTYADYALADEIIADEIKTQGAARRVKRNTWTGQSSGDSGGGGTAALKLIRRTVARMQPRVAQILPVTSGDLLRRKELNTTSAIHAMRVPDLDWLELNGHCIDMNMATTSSDDVSSLTSGAAGVAVTRTAKRGQAISTIPLLLSFEEQHDAAPCFSSLESSLRLCPMLSKGSLLTTSIPTEANARLEWSDWNDDNERARQLSPTEVLDLYLTKLSLEMVATKSVAPGDAIRVFVTEYSDGNALSSIIEYPDAWRVGMEAPTIGQRLGDVGDVPETSEESQQEQMEVCGNSSDSVEKMVAAPESEEGPVVEVVDTDVVVEQQPEKVEEPVKPIDGETEEQQHPDGATGMPIDVKAPIPAEQRQELAQENVAEEEAMNVEEMVQNLPPEKRRRTWRRNRQMM